MSPVFFRLHGDKLAAESWKREALRQLTVTRDLVKGLSPEGVRRVAFTDAVTGELLAEMRLHAGPAHCFSGLSNDIVDIHVPLREPEMGTDTVREDDSPVRELLYFYNLSHGMGFVWDCEKNTHFLIKGKKHLDFHEEIYPLVRDRIRSAEIKKEDQVEIEDVSETSSLTGEFPDFIAPDVYNGWRVDSGGEFHANTIYRGRNNGGVWNYAAQDSKFKTLSIPFLEGFSDKVFGYARDRVEQITVSNASDCTGMTLYFDEDGHEIYLDELFSSYGVPDYMKRGLYQDKYFTGELPDYEWTGSLGDSIISSYGGGGYAITPVLNDTLPIATSRDSGSLEPLKFLSAVELPAPVPGYFRSDVEQPAVVASFETNARSVELHELGLGYSALRGLNHFLVYEAIRTFRFNNYRPSYDYEKRKFRNTINGGLYDLWWRFEFFEQNRYYTFNRKLHYENELAVHCAAVLKKFDSRQADLPRNTAFEQAMQEFQAFLESEYGIPPYGSAWGADCFGFFLHSASGPIQESREYLQGVASGRIVPGESYVESPWDYHFHKAIRMR